MIIRIHEESNNPIINVRLSRNLSGRVCLSVVDDTGTNVQGGGLLSLTGDGMLMLHSCMNPACGFKLDSVGRIKLNHPIQQ